MLAMTKAHGPIAASVLDALETRFPEVPRSLLALTLESYWPRADKAAAAMERMRQSYSPPVTHDDEGV